MDIDDKALDNVSQKDLEGRTDKEAGPDQKIKQDEGSSSADNDAPLEEDMSDVEAADSVASEHPDN